MKFEEATAELKKAVEDTPAAQAHAAPAVSAPDNEQSLVLLQALMSGSDFGGPRG